MHNATLAGVIVNFSVTLVCDFLAAAVSCRRNCRFAFAAADDFNAAMIDCDRLLLSVLIEYIIVKCYNLRGQIFSQ